MRVLYVTACASLPEINHLGDTLSLRKMPTAGSAKGAIPANQASILPAKRWAKFLDKPTTAAAFNWLLWRPGPAWKAGIFRNKFFPPYFFLRATSYEKRFLRRLARIC